MPEAAFFPHSEHWHLHVSKIHSLMFWLLQQSPLQSSTNDTITSTTLLWMRMGVFYVTTKRTSGGDISISAMAQDGIHWIPDVFLSLVSIMRFLITYVCFWYCAMSDFVPLSILDWHLTHYMIRRVYWWSIHYLGPFKRFYSKTHREGFSHWCVVRPCNKKCLYV